VVVVEPLIVGKVLAYEVVAVVVNWATTLVDVVGV